LALLFAFHTLMAYRMGDRNHPLAHTALPIPYFLFEAAHFVFDLLHGSCQYPCAIVQQTAVRRIMHIAFHHRRVHPHLPPTNHLPSLGQSHNPIVQLAQRFRPDRLPETNQRLFNHPAEPGRRHGRARGPALPHRAGTRLAGLPADLARPL
jgi:hypothetical protein